MCFLIQAVFFHARNFRYIKSHTLKIENMADIWLLNSTSLGKSSDTFFIQSIGGPVRHGFGSYGSVEIDAWSVPVQAYPFHSSTFKIDSYIGKSFQNSLSVSFMAVFFFDEDIFQIQSASSDKCREVEIIKSESDFLPVFHGKNRHLPVSHRKDTFPKSSHQPWLHRTSFHIRLSVW